MSKQDNKRLRLIYEYLKEKKLVKNKADFAKQLKANQANVSLMLRNERGVPASLKISLCEVFSLSKDFVFYGKGDMHTPETSPSEIEALKNQIKSLQKELELKDKIIALMESKK